MLVLFLLPHSVSILGECCLANVSFLIAKMIRFRNLNISHVVKCIKEFDYVQCTVPYVNGT